MLIKHHISLKKIVICSPSIFKKYINAKNVSVK